jgi:hypothetical protein
MLSCGVKIVDSEKKGPAKSLHKNATTLDYENGFTALAIWSFHIVDQTGDLKGMTPRFGIGPVGATERLSEYLRTGKAQVAMAPKEYMSSHASVKPIDGSWTQKNGQAVYNGMFAVEFRSGEHQIFQVLVESNTANSETWVNIPLNATCSVEQGKIYDLKLLEIIISERVAVEGRKEVFYRHSIETPATVISNWNKFSQLYPTFTMPNMSIVNDCSFMVSVCGSQ